MHSFTLPLPMLREYMELRNGRLFFRKSGREVTSLKPNGYLQATVCGRPICAHRIVFALTHNRWPVGYVDHVNGNRADNRACNLREASPTQNQANRRKQCNNTSGYKGVHWCKKKKRWCAMISANKKRKNLGYFTSAKAANTAYKKAAAQLHGEFMHKARC